MIRARPWNSPPIGRCTLVFYWQTGMPKNSLSMEKDGELSPAELDRVYRTACSISPIPEDIWMDAGSLYTARNLENGEYFVKQGEIATEFALVLSGTLKEYYVTRKGNEYIKTFIFPGEYTGSYYDLLTGQPSTCRIRALSDCRLAVASFAQSRLLFQKNIIWERFGRVFAEMVYLKKAKREYELLALSAEERYGSLLESQPEIENSLSQYNIASYLGITPVSLSRIRSRIKKDPE